MEAAADVNLDGPGTDEGGQDVDKGPVGHFAVN